MPKFKEEKKSCSKGKQSSKSYKRSGKYDEKDAKYSKSNDLSGNNDFKWYSLNKNLVEASCRLPFARPLGNRVELGYTTVTSGGTVTNGTTTQPLPGILTFDMVPSIGCSIYGTQTIDVASKSIYSWVRHANSGHTNYDSPDLMIYLLAASNIYAAAGYMLKIYSCINKYEPTNRYYPDGILTALHVDPVFARSNIADLRYYMAQWWKKAASIFTPKKLPMFEKAFWMYTQIFEEDKTGKSGLYQYCPAGFHRFNATKYTTGGCLEFQALPATFNSMSVFTTYFDALLDVIINDEDMGIMSGDIKKAFDNDVWSLGDFPYDSTIVSVRDSFVLQQMHNTRAYHLMTSDDLLDIVQDNTTNELLYFPTFKASTNYDSILYDVRGGGHLLDIDSEVPTVDEVMEATQYINSVTLKVGGISGRITKFSTITGQTFTNNKSFIITNASDFICSEIRITHFNANGTAFVDEYYHNDSESLSSGTQTATKVWSFCSWLSSFSFAPMFNLNTNTPFLANMHNYTIVASEVIDNIHDTSWLSLLCIPAQEHLK